MARVIGTVTLDGEPVKQSESIRCQVTLKPIRGGAAGTGSIDESGRFSVTVGASPSLPPGRYTASVRVRKVTPSNTPGGYAASENLSAERFASTTTSGLIYDLTPGTNELSIEVSSKP